MNQKSWASCVKVETFFAYFSISVKNDCLSEQYLLQLKMRCLSSSTLPDEHTLQILFKAGTFCIYKLQFIT